MRAELQCKEVEYSGMILYDAWQTGVYVNLAERNN